MRVPCFPDCPGAPTWRDDKGRIFCERCWPRWELELQRRLQGQIAVQRAAEGFGPAARVAAVPRAFAEADRELGEDQRSALAAMDSGDNVYLSGVAGTGKSFLMRRWLEGRSDAAVVAASGVAAEHLGGVTLHRWLGLRPGVSVKSLVEQPWWRFSRAKRIAEADVLVVDEVSMVDADTFDSASRLCQLARGDSRPFGGLQVVLVGDMAQLPPVPERGGPPPRFAFESETWRELSPRSVELRQVFRQADASFAALLSAVRIGRPDIPVMRALRTRLRAFNSAGSVRLFARNSVVDRENRKELEALPGQQHSYFASDSADDEADLAVLSEKNCFTMPAVLGLKVGARVIFTKNAGQEFGDKWANGTSGIVSSLDPIVVDLDRGGSVHAQRMTHEVRCQGKVLARRTQFPLRLAWCLTIHKSQGMTIDRMSVDLDGCFEYGQAYVALSRARSIENLNVERMCGANKIKIHPKVAAFLRGEYRE